MNWKYVKIYFYLTMLIFIIVYQTYKNSYCKQKNKPKTGMPHSVVIRKVVHSNVSRQTRVMKYILLWTHPEDTPFVYLGQGTSVFENKTCQWTNCYVTADRNFLGDYTKFDVIVFSSSRLSEMSFYSDIPERRSARQKYVFASVESAAYYPICTDEWHAFFNWTWTYKLNSDSVWGYLIVRNSTGHVIGPKVDMQWMDSRDMKDTNDHLRSKLQSKNKIAAWFVSNCDTLSLREEFVKEIDFELKKYQLGIDIYGRCGDHYCPRKKINQCFKLLEKEYFFYLAFENSISEDYVTEKIMYALQHNTVPIVYGGANYSRFLPNGSYLDAREMGPAKLARIMFQLANNRNAYAQYFRWKHYYSYNYRHESPHTDDYCRFCAMLNDENLVKSHYYYDDIGRWWSGKSTKCTRHFR